MNKTSISFLAIFVLLATQVLAQEISQKAAWLYSMISVVAVSLISLVGLVLLTLHKEILKKLLLFLISFSVGALLGDAFIHVLPEMAELYGFTFISSVYVIFGILFFFILEKVIHWRHCHMPESKNHIHPFAYTNLIGDGFHNFIDGLLIGGSYLVSVQVGIATTIAVLLHEIPQEIGDISVLIHGGFSRAKAIFFNFITALAAIAGASLALLITTASESFPKFLLPFTAGGFIYIAGSDLLPELHKEVKVSQSALQLGGIVFGVTIMALLLLLE